MALSASWPIHTHAEAEVSVNSLHVVTLEYQIHFFSNELVFPI